MGIAVFVVVSCLLCACQPAAVPQSQPHPKRWKRDDVWRGVHLFVQKNHQVNGLIEALPKYAKRGVNVLILQINYGFEFKSHPELRRPDCIDLDHARRLVAAAREHRIRLIPEFNCLGHQPNLSSLANHSDWMEPVDPSGDKEVAHMLSWCPRNPAVMPVALDLIDEISDAFDATAFHVGMDEVFCIASPVCPRCKGNDPAQLYAQVANDLHDHIVKRRKMEMLMWGDRLLDGKLLGHSKWEASRNGTAGAIDLIPKDIIVCDWHYENKTNYPSVPMLLEKGFRVWPSGWEPVEASLAFNRYVQQLEHTNVLGYLCTVWSAASVHAVPEWAPLVEVSKNW